MTYENHVDVIDKQQMVSAQQNVALIRLAIVILLIFVILLFVALTIILM